MPQSHTPVHACCCVLAQVPPEVQAIADMISRRGESASSKPAAGAPRQRYWTEKELVMDEQPYKCVRGLPRRDVLLGVGWRWGRCPRWCKDVWVSARRRRCVLIVVVRARVVGSCLMLVKMLGDHMMLAKGIPSVAGEAMNRLVELLRVSGNVCSHVVPCWFSTVTLSPVASSRRV